MASSYLFMKGRITKENVVTLQPYRSNTFCHLPECGYNWRILWQMKTGKQLLHDAIYVWRHINGLIEAESRLESQRLKRSEEMAANSE